MRCVVQRVTKASATVAGELISQIGPGICVLVGIHKDDTVKDIEWMAKKLVNLRIFDGPDGSRWAASVQDRNYEILCLSQFTLYATVKGTKPDFHKSMRADDCSSGPSSKAFFEDLVSRLSSSLPSRVQQGRFGAYSQIDIQNDGPVTIVLESRNESEKAKQAT